MLSKYISDPQSRIETFLHSDDTAKLRLFDCGPHGLEFFTWCREHGVDLSSNNRPYLKAAVYFSASCDDAIRLWRYITGYHDDDPAWRIWLKDSDKYDNDFFGNRDAILRADEEERTYKQNREIVQNHIREMLRGSSDFHNLVIEWAVATTPNKRAKLFDQLKDAYQRMCGSLEVAEIFDFKNYCFCAPQ